MSLSLGIVGLPNVGKSTLFNALTNLQVDASAYPFCTIDPNTGVVEVPDDRLEQLATVISTGRILHATVEFTDIAGLVAGASRGEGLGNKFLHHIREVDAIAHVVRFFGEQDVAHVHGKVDPVDDIRTIHLELILADLELVTRKYQETRDRHKGKITPAMELRLSGLEKIKAALESEQLARTVNLTDKEVEQLNDVPLLTQKPMFFVANVSEEQLGLTPTEVQAQLGVAEPVIPLCAKLEMDISKLPPEERPEFLAEYGLERSGLDRVIVSGYQTLNLISYFTAGEKEIRAWTIREGTLAPQAASVIHTDFEKGFIKADVVQWKDLLEGGGWTGAREGGKVRLEGKEYVVQDGDVMVFKFNV